MAWPPVAVCLLLVVAVPVLRYRAETTVDVAFLGCATGSRTSSCSWPRCCSAPPRAP